MATEAKPKPTPKPPKAPPPSQPPPGPSTPPPPTPTAAEFATLRALLSRYGLLSLYGQAVEWMISGVADSPERLELALRETPEFRARFKGLFDREAAGLPPISVDEYLAYEDQAFQMMRELGFPPGFYDDPDDFANLIGANVSLNEFRQRAEAYADAAAVGREQYRVELARHFQGALVGDEVDALTDGDLAALLVDPSRALPALRQRLQAAQISAAGVGSGFGALSFEEATRLGAAGMDEAQARQALGALAQQGSVTGALAGEGEGVARETQLGAVAGESGAVSALERARRRRLGGFEGAGGFATGREGVSGLGSS